MFVFSPAQMSSNNVHVFAELVTSVMKCPQRPLPDSALELHIPSKEVSKLLLKLYWFRKLLIIHSTLINMTSLAIWY